MQVNDEELEAWLTRSIRKKKALSEPERAYRIAFRRSHGWDEEFKRAREMRKKIIERQSRYGAQKRANSKYRKSDRFRNTIAARSRFKSIIKSKRKASEYSEMIGCTPDFLCNWLSSKWTDGMSWENYGTNGWHIDHIRPCHSFDLSNPDQIKECFNYKNLQPLWRHDHQIKSWEYAKTAGILKKKPTALL